MNEEIKAKVFAECKTNYKFVLKRFKFLKSMNRIHRPIDHVETVEAWQSGIDEYKKSLTINNNLTLDL